jgi:hypothetical protein
MFGDVMMVLKINMKSAAALHKRQKPHAACAHSVELQSYLKWSET